MRTLALTAAFALAAPAIHAQHRMEYLDRGLVALRTGADQVVLSWRLLGSDPADSGFHVYRSTGGSAYERITVAPLTGSTQFADCGADFSQDLRYRVRCIHKGSIEDTSKPCLLAAGTPPFDHFTLPLTKPADGTTPLGDSYTYSANDCSVADLDGDGEYELILKWDPSNAKDNSQSGYTGNVFLDAYRFDGTLLWRVDLGINIRAGAHYTQFIAYDFDGDGKAEVACRTAPGTKDGQGDDIADAAKWQNAGGPARPSFSATDDYRNGSGYILEGPEFLTVFDGGTGDELVSTSFNPFRDPDAQDHSPGTTRINQVWGDGYGNRIDRFLAGLAYLDGSEPSFIMCRGYYTRTFLTAWDWRGGTLSRRWVFDSAAAGNSGYAGQGAHSLTVGDVDADGKDEIVYGACAIDDDGTGLYSTGLGHGDATHLSDMDPARPGLEYWMVHESPSAYGPYGSSFHEAATGGVVFGVDGTGSDVGRGVAGDIDPRTLGYETWSSRASLHDVAGNQITTSRPGPMNFMCWWDGDLLRELLDGTTISKWNWNTNSTSALLSPAGIASNNSTKATPCLSADLFGDWREEVVWKESDSSALRIYTSTIPTTHRLPTLMHDRQYREAIAWQNVGYNQPPHPGYYLGEGMGTAPTPAFTTVPSATAPAPVADRFAIWLTGRGLDPGLDPDLDHDGNGSSLFTEYAFGLDEGLTLAIHQNSGTVMLELPAIRPELDYTLEHTTDFSSWSSLGTFAGTDGAILDYEPDTSDPEGFYRLTAIATAGDVRQVTVTTQAEDASFNGSLDSNHAGFHGTGFINADTTGSFIEWTNLDGGIGGQATLSFRFALGATTSRTGVLVVNGVAQAITFDPTGAWDAWTTLDIPATLNPGTTNTIRLETNGEDLANIDELSVTFLTEAADEPTVSLALPVIEPYQTANLFIIGDSTVANYGSSYYPWKGWGQVFQQFVDPARIAVTNRARGGRSSKSFIVEGLWDSLKAETQPGDYLLIQWGHNDRDWTKPERYTTETEYKGYLTQYITEARALGVTPVFVTPMVMNAWSGSTMRNVFTESGNDYAGWMKEIAAGLDVPLIDLNQKSYDFFSVLDYDTNGRFFYNTYVAGEYPNYPTGNTDGTHFQEMGALMMAKFVAEGLREIDPDPRVSALENGLRPQYPLAIQANAPAAGRVSLSTEFPEGATFTLKALENSGHTFINWKDGANATFATDSMTTFTVAPQSYRFTAYFDDETPVAPPAAGSVIPGGVPFDFVIRLTADAYDPTEDIDLVEFFDDDTGAKLGEDATPPYELYWEAGSGVHHVRADSTNKLGIKTRSAVMTIDTGAPNTPPVATLTSPANGSTFDAGDVVTLAATASDSDGFVAKVRFFVDGGFIGEDTTAPYAVDWTDIPGGSHTLTARAYDNRGAASADSSVTVSVNFGTTGNLLQEAESGTLAGSFTVVTDAAASGGQAVEAVSGPADTNYVEFTFDVPTAGDYLLRARIKAIDGNHDSMFVSIDGAAADQILWDTARSTGYVDDYVFDRTEAIDPKVFTLTAGTHTIRFGYRENLFLDQVELEAAP